MRDRERETERGRAAESEEGKRQVRAKEFAGRGRKEGR